MEMRSTYYMTSRLKVERVERQDYTAREAIRWPYVAEKTDEGVKISQPMVAGWGFLRYSGTSVRPVCIIHEKK